ncbi:MAG: 3-phosphoshikimate 1-carboxyvinyltransferase [Calditrichaeota bacterium]|nr:3-phosphoshikimate 1-carboxyvinyltransferase [Calditrichota bacterium]
MVNKFTTAHVRCATTPLRARCVLPGDKSVSIRRALVSLLDAQTVTLENYGTGADCLAALSCIDALGKHVRRDGNKVTISGEAAKTSATLDCRNSGTTARLLMGLLAGRPGSWVLTGDSSLSARPMLRVVEPLRLMGAKIELSREGTLPARIEGADLTGHEHDLSLSSAQVKSAILLAGLHARGVTRVREPLNSRDHTERLLGLRQSEDRFWSVMREMQADHTPELSGAIPGDLSSAAFWGVAALLVPDSEAVIEGVLLNPLRAGWIEVLRRAGAAIEAAVEDQSGGESVGNIVIRNGKLKPLSISADEVPTLIDEIPALSVLAATISGESVFHQVGELRVKESDRLSAIVEQITCLGAKAAVKRDDLVIHGGALRGAELDAHGDHRIAIASVIAGLAAQGTTTVSDAACADISYPSFYNELLTHLPDSLSFS